MNITSNTHPRRNVVRTAEEWISLNLNLEASEPIFGTAQNVIVGPRSKTLIEAAEKSFKSTFVMRIMMGLAMGVTIFPELPVHQPRKVLYIHGELSDSELISRTLGASSELPRPLTNFDQV